MESTGSHGTRRKRSLQVGEYALDMVLLIDAACGALRVVCAVPFPWLTERPALATAAERLQRLAQVPAAQARLNALGVGIFVLVQGATDQEQHGAAGCGGGCLGLIWGKRKSELTARIIDLIRPAQSADTHAERSGTAVVPMFVLPLPFIPATQHAACEEISRAIASRIGQGEPEHR